jgi:predicted nuclease of predicted toxin-antitoxin system
MKFLADMGISPLTVQVLRQQGYDAIHLYEAGLERLPDPLIVEKARQEERVILTFDLDFTDLLAMSSLSLPSVIIFRLQMTKPAFVSTRLLSVLEECGEALDRGAIVIVDESRYRLRQLPLEL